MSIVRTFKQRGQGMVEYIIILAMIGIAAIGVYSLFGKTVRNQGAAIANELSGKGGTSQITKAQSASGDAASNANTGHDMGNYSTGNTGH